MSILKKIIHKGGKTLDTAEKELKGILGSVTKGVRHAKRTKMAQTLLFGKNLFFVLGAGALIVLGGLSLWFATLPIPDISSFNEKILGQSTKIFDRTGKVLLYDVGQNVRRTIVPLESMSPHIKNATIAIEDEDFYEHHGIKISSITRAIFKNILNEIGFGPGYTQGGSTITQQVVKNSLLTRDKTITRKIKEWFLAIKLERALAKDEILNLYLNQSSYGGTIYGVEEAAQAYFGKSSTDLTAAESAYLAALPQAPTRYSPYGNHRDELEARKNFVLQKMRDRQMLTDEEYEKAKNEKVVFADQFSRGIKAPHFVMYVKEYLEERYGDRLVTEGGLKVITTLDYELQKKAEEIIEKKALENDKLYHATNAGLVAINARQGEILVMVGSRNYFDKDIDGNYNITTAKRQPGSSFKPFVYAAAFEKGYTPETVLFDLKTQFSTSCAPSDFSDEGGCYSPENYDGNFRGPISLRNALAQSINIPAVKLLYLVGVNNALDTAKKMGITTLEDSSRYGLSLVLGGGEVTLVDMTSAYGVFANAGEKVAVSPVLRVEDKNGKVLEEHEVNKTRVLPKDTALTVADILKDNEARAPVFTTRSSMYFPDRDVAAKTGTTNNYRDAWIVGFTPEISVGAWAGNNDNSSIDRRVAGFIVAPMWREFMDEILKEFPDEKFEKPEQRDLSSLKPILQGKWQGTTVAQDDNGNQVATLDVHTILQYIDKDNPLGPAPRNPAADPQYDNWEYSIRNWAGTQGIISEPPISPIDGENGKVSVSIKSPKNKSSIDADRKSTIEVRVVSENPISRVDYFANGKFLGSSSVIPYSISFVPSALGIESGSVTVRAVAYDSKGGRAEDTSTYEIKGQ